MKEFPLPYPHKNHKVEFEYGEVHYGELGSLHSIEFFIHDDDLGPNDFIEGLDESIILICYASFYTDYEQFDSWPDVMRDSLSMFAEEFSEWLTLNSITQFWHESGEDEWMRLDDNPDFDVEVFCFHAYIKIDKPLLS